MQFAIGENRAAKFFLKEKHNCILLYLYAKFNEALGIANRSASVANNIRHSRKPQRQAVIQ